MIIYLGWKGPIETKEARLIVTAGRPDKITIKYKDNPPMVFEHVYKNAKGSLAAMRGDMETASNNELTMKQLRGEEWKEVVAIKEPPFDVTAKARAIAQEAKEAEEAQSIRWLKKHGKYEAAMRAKHGDPADGRATYKEAAQSLYARILPAIHEAGYTLSHYGGDWPNPQYRLINMDSGDWDDEGPYSENNGVFSLYELAGLFGDPAADDLARRFIDEDSGEVIGKKKENLEAVAS